MSINISSLTYEVDNKKILNEISLKIELGEILCVLGPNGSGKSTLVNLISGNFEATKGDIFFDKVDLKKISIEDRAFTRSVMTQSQPIVFDFTVREIIEMGWLKRGNFNFSKDFKYVFNQVVDEASIENLTEKKFNVLSGGEQKRVHLARTLIQAWRPSNSNDPKYIFLDEPTANLDINYEKKVMEIVRKKADEGIGILLIVHDINLACKYSDKIAVLKDGFLLGFGSPENILTEEILSNAYDLPVKVIKNPLSFEY